MKTPILRGMRDIANNYDGYVVDLWGVVHDGIAVFPGVIKTLQKLRAAAKKLVFLSNAPRRAEVVASQLNSLGITALSAAACYSRERVVEVLLQHGAELNPQDPAWPALAAAAQGGKERVVDLLLRRGDRLERL